MATGMELVLSLRSAREWHSILEEDFGKPGAANAGESARRLERILAAARREGLEAQKKGRKSSAPLLENLALQEAQVNGAVQYLERRQASGAQLDEDWRALTANGKRSEESFGESRAALGMAEQLPLLAGGEAQLRVLGVAKRFLEAAEFRFDRQELTAYLVTLQGEVELTNAEIAALKGFLSQVLLEQVVGHARKL